ncbi:peptidase inhibitor family I36 protein [Actinokineospora inagensis]|uniref:peptidase inhibitor family I36 protein n=1 Tax=Actinokineospora inagensis TaxID=103730 RepID=UPI0004248B07|nr:peptidase inhibitor family I36 protein [Actinokineospora inagensis]
MAFRIVIAVLLACFGLALPASAAQVPCERGELCLWAGSSFRGEVGKFGLGTVTEGECVPVGRDTRSFVNWLRRDVTVYESPDCATEADFTTYPGLGTYVPESPFVVRAIQVWSP